jgi:uncharacterized protein (DUF427 family)
VSLTTGRGPLSANPAGRFSAPLPAGVSYVEPFPRRVRATRQGATVVDSERAVLVHRTGQPPAYAFPVADVTGVGAAPDPAAPGHVAVAWDAADAWYEEEERVSGHPRNPYHRVDSLRTTRRLRVQAGGVALVDTTDTLGVYETSLAPKLYVRPDQVRMDLLERSATTTYCPYKGTAKYWSARVGGGLVADVAWSYDDPLPESLPLAGMLSFDPQRAAVDAELPGDG